MKNKIILIVGGTGSWSRALIGKLLDRGAAQIRIYARNESRMVSVKQEYPDNRVVPIVGDIRDKERLMEASRDCDVIFHMAALKHVPICESMPTEAILTNVIGTQHVIDCAVANRVSKVICASTDKAIEPNCTYGCTKLLGEKLIQAANESGGKSKFIIFRSGNLMGSSGSVIPLFKKQIESNYYVNLTHKKMNRFFIPMDKASDLLIEAAIRGAGGEIFLPRMHSFFIYDLAKYLLEKNGLDEKNIKIVGLRPGEKINEFMATEEEADHIYRINDDMSLIVKNDIHQWINNGFVQKDECYKYRSQDAVVFYRKTVELLSQMDI